MPPMTNLLLLFVPFFALVLLGWRAVRVRLLPLEGIPALNAFVLYFGLTAMVFRLAASGALAHQGLGSLLLVYATGGLGVLSAAMVWAGRQRLRPLDAGMAALVTVFPNTGFLGLPLLTGLLGAHAAGTVAATLVVDVLLFSSLCLALAHAKGAGREQGRGGWRAAAWRSFRGAVRNPLLWSMAAGLLVWLLQVPVPQPVDETLRLLAVAASPTALFTLGAMLARAQVAARRSRPQAGPRPAQAAAHPAIPAVLKLAVHPALVQALGWMAQRAGWPVSAEGLLTLTLAAALPSASNVAMLAEREAADTGLVARIVLWTTILSLATIAGWAWLLGVQPRLAP